MHRIILDSKKARAFFEVVGVTFNNNGRDYSFPQTPREPTSQDLGRRVMRLALEISKREQAIRESVPEIGAIVTIARRAKSGESIGRAKSGRYWRGESRPPSLASEFTAFLGVALSLMLGRKGDDDEPEFGKLIRFFPTYDIDSSGKPAFGIPEGNQVLAGHRIVFFAEDDGVTKEGLETIAMIIKGILSVRIHREMLMPTSEEQQELDEITDSADREEAVHELLAYKRSRLTACVVFLITNRSSAEITSELTSALGFTPEIWTFFDNSPPPAKVGTGD